MTKPSIKRPDDWGAGLRFAGKTLSTKTVRRATTPAEVIPVCLAHNLRQGSDGHRHRYPPDPKRLNLNEVLRGPTRAKTATALAATALFELGINTVRANAVMGIELVFQPPAGHDTPMFWAECLAWVDARYKHVLLAVVHRDQYRPHMHVLVLALDGGRLAGNAMTAGKNRFIYQRRDYFDFMRDTLGLRPDREHKTKTLTDLAVSSGRGPKTKVAADHRDAKLLRASAGMKTNPHAHIESGHGGSVLDAANPHAQQKAPTPLLRSFSPSAEAHNFWPASPCGWALKQPRLHGLVSGLPEKLHPTNGLVWAAAMLAPHQIEGAALKPGRPPCDDTRRSSEIGVMVTDTRSNKAASDPLAFAEFAAAISRSLEDGDIPSAGALVTAMAAAIADGAALQAVAGNAPTQPGLAGIGAPARPTSKAGKAKAARSGHRGGRRAALRQSLAAIKVVLLQRRELMDRSKPAGQDRPTRPATGPPSNES